MTRTHTYAIALVLASVFAGQAMAATGGTPVTRAQVEAELAEAVRTGNLITSQIGLKLNEQYPQNYPAQHSAVKTREQVEAELAEAVRTGDVITSQIGLKLNEQYPQNYPAQRSIAGSGSDGSHSKA